jgi:hypothetical protein
MAVQSLWSISWLMQVNGYTRAVAADHLAGMSIAMLIAYLLTGLLATGLARRGIKPVMLLIAGVGCSLLTLALIATEALGQTHFLWIAYGTFSSFGTLAYSQLAAGFPVASLGPRQHRFQPDGLHRRLRCPVGTWPIDRSAAGAGANCSKRSSPRVPCLARHTIGRLRLVRGCRPQRPHRVKQTVSDRAAGQRRDVRSRATAADRRRCLCPRSGAGTRLPTGTPAGRQEEGPARHRSVFRAGRS